MSYFWHTISIYILIVLYLWHLVAVEDFVFGEGEG